MTPINSQLTFETVLPPLCGKAETNSDLYFVYVYLCHISASKPIPLLKTEGLLFPLLKSYREALKKIPEEQKQAVTDANKLFKAYWRYQTCLLFIDEDIKKLEGEIKTIDTNLKKPRQKIKNETGCKTEQKRKIRQLFDEKSSLNIKLLELKSKKIEQEKTPEKRSIEQLFSIEKFT